MSLSCPTGSVRPLVPGDPLPGAASLSTFLPDKTSKAEPRPRQRLRLTAKGTEKKGPGRHPDGDGLILQVTNNGSRSWILRTVVRGKRKDIGLGGWPLVSLGEARVQAAALRKIARSGGDPVAVRDKAKLVMPVFKMAAATVHREQKRSWKNSKHVKQWISTLEQYAYPHLADTPVDLIRSEHIVRTMSPIWLLKAETARRVLQRIGTVLLWAKGNGYRGDSPTDEIAAARQALPRQNDRKRHHKALPYEEVPEFIQKVRAFSMSDPIKLAFEFLILTAARTNEVLYARWPEIDFKNRVWLIPGARMKAKRDHSVPLSDRCLEILRAARSITKNTDGFLFQGVVPGKPLSNMAFLMVIRRMNGHITTHGFRSSFRVWCAEQTHFPREVAEAALAHVVRDATEAAYMRSTFFEKRKNLMAEWTAFAVGHDRKEACVKTVEHKERLAGLS